MTTLVESCEISPPPGGEAELSLPLTFFDIVWLHFHPIRRLLFYDYPGSKPHFFDTLVPELKQSLSLTLKHYTPVAGNLLYPLIPEKPTFRYVLGDSVSLKIFESTNDFDRLVGNFARDSDQFYDYIPQLPPIRNEPDYKIVPLIALQVTLFPGKGICIGFSNHHSIGDASSVVGFLRSWALINKLQGDEEVIGEGNYLNPPCFDRKVIRDPLGVDTIFWNEMKKFPLKPSTFPLPTNRVRATILLNQENIKKLKDLVMRERPGLVYLSSFVVTAAYVWKNLVKSGDMIGEETGENRDEYFIFAVDVRSRINPPVPANYFGNCLGYGMAKLGHGKLVGDEGFVIAAEAIAEDIRNRVNNKEEVLKGVENWMSDFKECFGTNVLGVSGSPKFDLYSADFGWGEARKLEVLSIDGEKYSVSLSKSRVSDGGIEVGLSLSKAKMEAFAAVFDDGLRYRQSSSLTSASKGLESPSPTPSQRIARSRGD